MATIAEQQASSGGVQLGFSAASGGGDDFANNGKQVLILKNDDASTKTATVVTTATIDGNSVADKLVAVPAGQTVLAGVFSPSIYGTSVSVTYSDVTSLSVTVVRVG